ncbi:uncharacterized protein N7496_005239 [Penicillium cataractarum]|uniref:Serum paraoxonase/arylesterase family protein n=1 Tax=Penicillium cataractarum TaxID=2100454 RepID=A0A9W9VFR1_9EURO|nr:uncharacterized protein N7496_005239 [Penicillium cataractarum]KAJ5377830.1 hypothetical protein N7496_005239 [Penicillium cataractarum]
MGLLSSAFLGLFTMLVAILGPAVLHIIRVSGPFLTPNPTVLGAGQGPIVIEDTVHCEDLHYHRPANLLFTACEDVKETRFDWFPGLGHLDAKTVGRGSIHVVDPKTFKSTRLAFENFNGPFVTHGIDVIEDPQDSDAVYIFAVNHLPNPDFTPDSPNNPAARSQIELFHHILHSTTVQHVRSIRHPLIQTPNDIYAASPTSFYVTNDHFYRSGLLRFIEDIWPSAKWTNVIHVHLEQLHNVPSATASLTASIAHEGLWNNNGLGHARSESEVIIASAIGGELYLASRENNTLTVRDTIVFDTVTDNPSYYVDPYKSDAHDASGFVIAGISQGFYLPQTGTDPDALDAVQVWYAKEKGGQGHGWEKRLLFEDDGRRIRTASAAVLVPVEMEKDEGEGKQGVKKAWLFVTGFLSESMIAVLVEL